MKSSSGRNSFWSCLPGDLLSGLAEQAAVKEGLNGAYGPDIILVFPSLDERNEPGCVQMCAAMIPRW